MDRLATGEAPGPLGIRRHLIAAGGLSEHDPFTPAELALQLIEGVGLVTFTSGSSGPSGSSVVALVGRDTLVVPVNVDALCVSATDVGPSSAAAADFQRLADGASVTTPYCARRSLAAVHRRDGHPGAGRAPALGAAGCARPRPNVYRINGHMLNELRLLGLPCGSLVALLEHLAAANPSIASAVSAIVGQPGEFDPAAWGQIADPGLTAGPEFGSADAFIGDPAAPAPGIMVAVMGAGAAARYRPLLVQGARIGRFPAVPDRWLVVRTVTPAAGPADPSSWRAWVVESDYLTTDASACFAGLTLGSDDPRAATPEGYATTVPAPGWEPGDARAAVPLPRPRGRARALARGRDRGADGRAQRARLGAGDVRGVLPGLPHRVRPVRRVRRPRHRLEPARPRAQPALLPGRRLALCADRRPARRRARRGYERRRRAGGAGMGSGTPAVPGPRAHAVRRRADGGPMGAQRHLRLVHR